MNTPTEQEAFADGRESVISYQAATEQGAERVAAWMVVKDSDFAYLKSEGYGSFMFPLDQFGQLQGVADCINAALSQRHGDSATPKDSASKEGK